MSAPLRCAIVGPGRTRNGLGPFVASFLEAEGVQVVAGVGRDPQRTTAACAALAEQFGHEVRAFVDVGAALRATSPDALVVASPVPSHLGALEAALAARVPVLCEKPLAPVDAAADARSLIERFGAAETLLVECCQWPFVLPAMRRLWSDLGDAPPRRVAMRLSPAGTGRAMLEDSLSHLLSVLQALAPVDQTARVVRARCAGASTYAVACELGFELTGSFGSIEVRFELRRATGQPRPAWLEIDGRRADRQIEPSSYAMQLAAPDGTTVPLDDPLRALVYGFVADVRTPDLDRLRDHAERIRQRLRLYTDLVSAWPSRPARRDDP